MSEEIWACDVCKRTLDDYPRADGNGVHMDHTSQDLRYADHKAVPALIPRDQIKMRCDICNHDAPAPYYTLIVKEFALNVANDSNRASVGMGTEWILDTECGLLLVAYDWAALTARGIRGWERLNNTKAGPQIQFAVTVLYTALRSKIVQIITPEEVTP